MSLRTGILNAASRAAALGIATLVATGGGCKYFDKGKVKALESDDWFRDGVDRFYLAVAPQNVPMAGSTTGAKVGQEMLFGIGCFGEDKRRDAVVPVARDACGNGPDTLPLNERYLVNHFPLAADPEKPKKGECVVLMGDDQVLAHLQLFPKDYQTGPGAQAMQAFFWSAGYCAVSLALLKQPVRAAVGNAITNMGAGAGKAAGGAGQAVSGAWQMMGRRFTRTPRSLITPPLAIKAGSPLHRKAQLEALANGVATPVIVRKGAFQAIEAAAGAQAAHLGRWITNGAAAFGGAAAFFLPPTGLVGKAFAGFQCFGTATSLWSVVADGQRNKNRSAFFKGMAQADQLTQEVLKTDPAGITFRFLVERGDLREAAAIYNPIYARQFNRNVIGMFEQGWQVFGKKPQYFFDTVRDIQAEIEGASQQVAAGGTGPGAGFGQASRVGEEGGAGSQGATGGQGVPGSQGNTGGQSGSGGSGSAGGQGNAGAPSGGAASMGSSPSGGTGAPAR